MHKIPYKIFITGAPGSGWAYIARWLENKINANISHRSISRSFTFWDSSRQILRNRHTGVFFGTGMEFSADLDVIDEPYSGDGTRIYRSHEWVYKIDEIRERFPDAWIIFVNRLDDICFDWWKHIGGFDITYPNYSWYQDDEMMLQKIKEQNEIMLQFCTEHNIEWTEYRTMFDDITPMINEYESYIAIYKPEKEENNV